MRTRLSVNDRISSSLVIAIIAWCFLSLPIFDSYGLTNHIIYHSDVWWVVIYQRAMHFVILFVIVYYFNKSKTVFWYNAESLYVENKATATEQVIPLKNITSLALQPVLLKAGRKQFTYEINTVDNEVFRATVRPGKKLAGFLKALEVENPDVMTTNTTFN